ncbi:unnamed protein product [Vitrella brassicaformis CCMP3155]|uniref:Uncharacterized protein n=3 Tax=Vitrella brassicaformis TaxID=1169539 RepID=A0A0G4FD26_VITBC|nr:unnamed protein product [Vitrella brassicaformis CCMP3155]|eukprot:CEM10754.1 unnamed protein product [Vitrella brassicaformis CCMP3155]
MLNKRAIVATATGLCSKRHRRASSSKGGNTPLGVVPEEQLQMAPAEVGTWQGVGQGYEPQKQPGHNAEGTIKYNPTPDYTIVIDALLKEKYRSQKTHEWADWIEHAPKDTPPEEVKEGLHLLADILLAQPVPTPPASRPPSRRASRPHTATGLREDITKAIEERYGGPADSEAEQAARRRWGEMTKLKTTYRQAYGTDKSNPAMAKMKMHPLHHMQADELSCYDILNPEALHMIEKWRRKANDNDMAKVTTALHALSGVLQEPPRRWQSQYKQNYVHDHRHNRVSTMAADHIKDNAQFSTLPVGTLLSTLNSIHRDKTLARRAREDAVRKRTNMNTDEFDRRMRPQTAAPRSASASPAVNEETAAEQPADKRRRAMTRPTSPEPGVGRREEDHHHQGEEEMVPADQRSDYVTSHPSLETTDAIRTLKRTYKHPLFGYTFPVPLGGREGCLMPGAATTYSHFDQFTPTSTVLAQWLKLHNKQPLPRPEPHSIVDTYKTFSVKECAGPPPAELAFFPTTPFDYSTHPWVKSTHKRPLSAPPIRANPPLLSSEPVVMFKQLVERDRRAEEARRKQTWQTVLGKMEGLKREERRQRRTRRDRGGPGSGGRPYTAGSGRSVSSGTSARGHAYKGYYHYVQPELSVSGQMPRYRYGNPRAPNGQWGAPVEALAPTDDRRDRWAAANLTYESALWQPPSKFYKSQGFYSGWPLRTKSTYAETYHRQAVAPQYSSMPITQLAKRKGATISQPGLPISPDPATLRRSQRKLETLFASGPAHPGSRVSPESHLLMYNRARQPSRAASRADGVTQRSCVSEGGGGRKMTLRDAVGRRQ